MKTQVIIHVVNTLLLSDNYVSGTGDTKIKLMFSVFEVYIPVGNQWSIMLSKSKYVRYGLQGGNCFV